MADRPILFSAPMVRAILEGRKTQTRRIAKVEWLGGANPNFTGWHAEQVGPRAWGLFCNSQGAHIPVRYAPGDRLWVRERAHIDGQEVNYAANLHPELDLSGLGFRPSIHMPRWASRITLIVEAVKVERLQDISEADAIAEGVEPKASGYTWPGSHHNAPAVTARTAFSMLWESINGFGAWEANPWVTAITFRPIFQNIDQVHHG